MKKQEETKIKVLYDSREQNPFLFNGYDYIVTSKETIPYGDYTLVGHEFPQDDHSVIIERKANTQELVTNIGQKWEQFVAEMEQVSRFKHKMILVCGPNNIDFLYRQGLTKIHPNYFFKQLAVLDIEYGVSTIFMPNREMAESYLVRYFNHIVRLMNNYG